MSPVTHFLTGWVLANAVDLNRRDRAIVTIAAVAPDVDGVGNSSRNTNASFSAPLALVFGLSPRITHSPRITRFALRSLCVCVRIPHLNAQVDIGKPSLRCFPSPPARRSCGSRGPDGFIWPIPYLFPFSNRWIWTWGGQWKLDAWPNIALTIVLLCVTVWIAVKRGVSPVDIFAPTADRSVVVALRRRFQTTD
jgi:hypothetical protein